MRRWLLVCAALLMTCTCGRAGFETEPAGRVGRLEVDPVPRVTNASSVLVTGETEADVIVIVDREPSARVAGAADATGRFAIPLPLVSGATHVLRVTATDLVVELASTDRDYLGALLRVRHDPSAPRAGFSDVSATAGVDVLVGVATGAAIADIDSDGDLDLIPAHANGLLINDGTAVFTWVTGTFVPTVGEVLRSAVVADYDNDGDLDLVGSVYPGEPVNPCLFRNELIESGSLQFSDVTVLMGLVGVHNQGGAGWLDYNADGWTDLFVEGGRNPSGNSMFRNEAGTGLTRFNAQDPIGINPSDLSGGTYNGQWIAVADYDVDGDVDLVVRHPNPTAGQLYRNAGDGSFSDVTGPASGFALLNDAHSVWNGSVLADFDNDGDFDIFAPHGDNNTGASHLYIQGSDKTFQEVAQLVGISDPIGSAIRSGADAGDFNNDGWLDILCGSEDGYRLFLNRGEAGVPRFDEVSLGESLTAASVSGAVLFADLDNDGDLDIYLVRSKEPDILYRNDLDDHNYLVVRLEGGGPAAGLSSRDAIGSVVRLWRRDGTLLGMREVNGAKGQGSQSPAFLHFGGVIPSEEYTVEARFLRSTVRRTVTPKRDGHVITIREL